MSRDAICVAARRLAGLSWGDPKTRAEYSRLLAPWDSPERAEQMASCQSSCALTVMAALLIAEVDGLVRGWRSRLACDPLREPRWGQYDSITYLEHLALQRGLHRPAGRERPELWPGTYWRIGGSAELGGEAHVGLVVGPPDADGWFPTIEGGQLDIKNPRPSPKNCTSIERKRRRLEGGPGRWTLGGRVLGYTCDAGALPTCGSGMPWELIGVEPC